MTAPVGVPETAAPTGPDPVAARRTPVGLLVVAVLLAAGIVAALGVGGLALAMPESSASLSARWPGDSGRAAVKAGKECVTRFLSVSRDSVDDDLERVLDCSTGQFHRQFQDGMPEVREAVVSNDVRAKGQVLRTAVVSAGADSAVLLIAIDASITNVNKPGGSEHHYRIRVGMSLVKGGWKVSKLEFVG